jgi:hypothetical protein
MVILPRSVIVTARARSCQSLGRRGRTGPLDILIEEIDNNPYQLDKNYFI